MHPASLPKFKTLLSFLLLASMLTGLFSCKEKTTAKLFEPPTPVKLLHRQVMGALPPGQLKNADYVSFYTSYNKITGEYEVIFQAYDANHKRVGGDKKLKKRNYDPVSFPTGLGIDDNLISIRDLDIIDASGKLKDFDSIRLTQKEYTDMRTGDKYLQYEVQVFPLAPAPNDVKYTLPCPPCYNCRPLPADCVVINKVATEDSTEIVTDSTKKAN